MSDKNFISKTFSVLSATLILLASFWVSSPALAASPNLASISGKVQAQNGSGSLQDLVGVNVGVEILGGGGVQQSQFVSEVTSAENGYSFEGLIPGTYRIYIDHTVDPQSQSKVDFASGQFSLDAIGNAYTAKPVYRYFKVGTRTEHLNLDLIAKSQTETGTVSGVLKDSEGAALLDGPAGAKVPASIEILNSAGEVEQTALANESGEYSTTLNVGRYSARVGCSSKGFVTCTYLGGASSFAEALEFDVTAQADTRNLDFSAKTLKTLSVQDPRTYYSEMQAFLGDTVEAFSDERITEPVQISYRWFSTSGLDLLYGREPKAVEGETSRMFTIPAGMKPALIFAEVTYSLEGYAPVTSTLTRNSQTITNSGFSAVGYSPKVSKVSKVTQISKPRAIAKLTFPIVTHFSSLEAPQKGAFWFICKTTKFTFDKYSLELSGGGCKSIGNADDFTKDNVVIPKGSKGKYLVASYFLQNNDYMVWSGTTKPLKLK
ncbi:MAG: hypothetical protein RLZ28_1146 [Actinomycetota bacterium]|jgi:hypothetical protein